MPRGRERSGNQTKDSLTTTYNIAATIERPDDLRTCCITAELEGSFNMERIAMQMRPHAQP